MKQSQVEDAAQFDPPEEGSSFGYRKIKRLSKQEQIELHRIMTSSKNEKEVHQAKTALFESVVPWIHRYVTRRHWFGDVDDLIGYAYEHVWENIHKFDPHRARLTTYVGALLNHKLTLRSIRYATAVTIPNIQNNDRLREKANKILYQTVSLSDLNNVDQDYKALSYEVVIDLEDNEIQDKKLADVLQSDVLTNRQKRILGKRAKGCTYREIGEVVGISRERVRQIFDDSIKKLRLTLGVETESSE